MTLKHIKIFVTVCECDCSITKAANKLFLAQPSVSLAIKELETYYNQVLFERIGRKLYLTSIGRLMLEKSIETLRLMNELEDISNNKDHFTVLHVGSSITIGTHWLPEIVSKFKTTNPLVSVQVKVNNSQEIENKIMSNHIDLGFIEGIVHSNQIISIPFMEDHLEVICSSANPLANRSLVTLDEIQSQPFALREEGSASRELLDYSMASYGININPIWECVSTQSIIQAVKNNLAISILPKKMIQEDLKSNEIIAIKVDGLEVNRKYFMIYHKNKHVTEPMKSFMDVVMDMVE